MQNENEDVTPSEIITSLTSESIQSLIKTIREKQVLLDSDVAILYGYETRRINETANRNKQRFPENFRFQLTKEEADDLVRSQFETLNESESNDEILKSQIATSRSTENPSHGGRRKLPYVYTEQGIAMLSGLLKNDIAIQVSINIMEAFVEMRRFLNTSQNVFDNIVGINNKLLNHDRRLSNQDTKIDEILDLLSTPDTNSQWIFFQGQFYDAYEWMFGVMQSVKTSIIIVDNYTDQSVLGLLTALPDTVDQVTIITKQPSRLPAQAIQSWTAQYGTLEVIQCDKFHDRFIVVDEKDVYAVGVSLKDLGKKCFAISKSEDVGRFLKYLNPIIQSSRQ
jgi:hypothetical protein